MATEPKESAETAILWGLGLIAGGFYSLYWFRDSPYSNPTERALPTLLMLAFVLLGAMCVSAALFKNGVEA